MSQPQQTQHHHHTNNGNNLSNISCSSANGNSSSSSLAALVPGGVVTTQNISTVIKPKENNNSMQFVKITPPDLSKKAVEQIRVAQESKITKDKLKEVEEEWQSNLLKWKSKRRQHFVAPSGNNGDEHEQNNNNLENGGGRKVKTFAEIIEQRARAGNRLNFNLQRYIGSGDEEEVEENGEESNDHHRREGFHDETNNGDVIDYKNDLDKDEGSPIMRDQQQSSSELIEKLESKHMQQPKSQIDNHTQSEPLAPQRLVKPMQAKPEATRQPELKPLPRAPSSPKPHLEMLKQKFESLNQQHQNPPPQRPVLSTQHRQLQQLPLNQRPMQQPQQVQLKQAPHQHLLPPTEFLPRSSLVEVRQQHQSERLSELPKSQPSQFSAPQQPPRLKPQHSPPQQRLEDIPTQRPSIVETQQISSLQHPRPPLYTHRREPSPPQPPSHQQKYQAPLPPLPCPPSTMNQLKQPSPEPCMRQQQNKLPPPSPPRSQHVPQPTPPLPSPSSTTSTESAPQQPIRNNNHNHKQSKHQDHQSSQNELDKEPPLMSVSGKRRCSSCKEELGRGAAAFVVESLNLVYHTNCFKCSVCHVDLSNGFRGVDVRVHAGALHCQNCYSKDGLNYSRV